MMGGGGPIAGVRQAAEGWGVAYDPNKVAADITHARRVQFGGGARASRHGVRRLARPRPIAASTRATCCRAASSGSTSATPGILAKAEGATTQVAPIVRTSPQAMQIAAEKFAGMPDAVGLLRDYKPEGKPLVLAARVSGTANSAFPEGAPKPKKEEPEKKEGDDKAKADGAKDAKEEPAKEAKDTTEARPKGDKPKDDKPKEEKAEAAPPPAKPHVASGKVNVIVVADTDLLNDQFWVEVRDFLGQQVAIPNAHNAAFVLDALENLSGSDALISLRGRGISDRPFELVESCAATPSGASATRSRRSPPG